MKPVWQPFLLDLTTMPAIDSPPSASDVVAPYMGVFFLSFAVAFIATPVMRWTANRWGVLDQPDAERLHLEHELAPFACLGLQHIDFHEPDVGKERLGRRSGHEVVEREREPLVTQQTAGLDDVEVDGHVLAKLDHR